MDAFENELYAHFVSLARCELDANVCPWSPDEHMMAKAIVKKIEEQEAEIERLQKLSGLMWRLIGCYKKNHRLSEKLLRDIKELKDDR